MPVVIALLNSYSGLAAAATGFVLDNSVLIIAGSLVGASGIILTQIMCKAMNRSLVGVLFGTLEAGESSATADEVYGGKVKSNSPEEVAMLLDGVQRVVIVPGYGMAVAQAQHVVRPDERPRRTRRHGQEFAVHPAAGRMPGHMNVLAGRSGNPLRTAQGDGRSEPDVLPDRRYDRHRCQRRRQPGRTHRSEQPRIAGMPILDVDKSRTVVVVKRSLEPRFRWHPRNPLLAMDNTLMLFGDGKKAMIDLVAALKE